MRSTVFAVLALAACAKADKSADSASAAMATPAAAMPAPVTLADVAGNWNMKGMNEKGDSTLV
ncbi:MAG TPA: hypothetical protein VI454_12875, partial [Verrucomicrobiae bacterium]